jgi:hypothetical protein
MREWRARQTRQHKHVERKYDELDRIITRMMPVCTLDPKRQFFTRF